MFGEDQVTILAIVGLKKKNTENKGLEEERIPDKLPEWVLNWEFLFLNGFSNYILSLYSVMIVAGYPISDVIRLRLRL